ncbi:hypothetical protein SAMN04489740_4070 [Arthrobacter alpinus]|uniref:Uncharacterized protein n=1 Tax=Arthrobacter alpinus TaxID=656366 RepID=A0A1H5PB72_9MICC|nr:hypothetical protein SAMN04489740_4070 [Arthrobacter alpinus]
MNSPPPGLVDSPPPVLVESPPPELVDSPPPELVDMPPPELVDSPPPELVDMPPPELVESPPPELVEAPPPEDLESPPPDDVERPPPLDVELSRGHVVMIETYLMAPTISATEHLRRNLLGHDSYMSRGLPNEESLKVSRWRSPGGHVPLVIKTVESKFVSRGGAEMTFDRLIT